MTAFWGWSIFLILLTLLSMAILSPPWLMLRWLRPRWRLPLGRFLALALVGDVALWYLIPLIVWRLLGKPTH